MRFQIKRGILVLSIIAVGAVFAFSTHNLPVAGAVNSGWVEKAGEGLIAPACGSSGTSNLTSCSNFAPSIDFTWRDYGDPDGLTCFTAGLYAKIGADPEFLVASRLPCGTDIWDINAGVGIPNPANFTWNSTSGIVPPLSNTHYDYSIRYRSISHDFGLGQTVAIDPNHLVMAYHTLSDFTNPIPIVQAAVSDDGGVSWDKSPVIDTYTKPGSGPLLYLAIDSVGNTVVVAYSTGGSAPDVRFSKSTDGGVTWPSSPVTVAGGAGSQRNSSIDILDADNIYVSYYDEPTTNLIFIRSSDGGAIWSAPIVIESAAGNIGKQSSIKAVNNQLVFIGYNFLRGGGPGLNAKVAKLTSADGGASWAQTIIPIETTTINNRAGDSLSIDATDASNIFFAYNRTDSSGSGYAKFSKSTTGGGTGTWSSPIVLAALSIGSSRGISLHAISASTIYVAYSDGDDPAVALFTKSTSGGGAGTWSTPFNVGDSPGGLIVPPADASNIYIPHGPDLSHSTDGGANWSSWIPKYILFLGDTGHIISSSTIPPSQPFDTNNCPGPIDYTVTTVINSGSGTITGPGISCPGDCNETYLSGTWITLMATPEAGYSFDSWTGACAGQGSSCSVLIDNDKTAGVNLITSPPPFDYTLSNSGTSYVTKTSGDAFTTNTITKTLIPPGVTDSVTLTVSGLPSGVSVDGISSQGCEPNCISTITFKVSPSASVGTYSIIVTGSPASASGPTSFDLVISGSPMTVSCVASPLTALLGETVTWSSEVDSGGAPPFTYSWNGTNIPTSPAPDTKDFSISYSTIGQKTATVIVTDSSLPTPSQANCSTQVRINFDPNFEEF